MGGPLNAEHRLHARGCLLRTGLGQLSCLAGCLVNALSLLANFRGTGSKIGSAAGDLLNGSAEFFAGRRQKLAGIDSVGDRSFRNSDDPLQGSDHCVKGCHSSVPPHPPPDNPRIHLSYLLPPRSWLPPAAAPVD